MKCPKCGGDNVNTQLVNEVKEVKKRKSFLYTITLGWIVFLIKWIVFTLPALVLKIFGISGNKTKLVSKTIAYSICQDCGHKWKI